MHASANMGCQGKSGPGKIHEVILVILLNHKRRFSTRAAGKGRKLTASNLNLRLLFHRRTEVQKNTRLQHSFALKTAAV